MLGKDRIKHIAGQKYWENLETNFSVENQGLEILSSVFWANCLIFAKKWANNEQMSDLLKKTSDLLICSFLVSDLSDSLTSLIFGEQPEQFAHITR